MFRFARARDILILTAAFLFAGHAAAQVEELSQRTAAPPGGEVNSQLVNDSADVPARTVYIELNRVDGASGYEVQIRPYEQRWSEPHRFNIADERLRVRLTPGHYDVRTRSLDGNDKPGRWSRWNDFWVQFKPPADVYPKHGTVIDPKADVDEKITFEWPKVPRANLYMFKLRDYEGRIIKKVQTKQTWISAEVKVGSSYSWSVLPRQSVKEPDAPEERTPYHEFSVAEPEPDRRSLYFKIGHVKKAEYYEFEFVKFISENETGEPSVYGSRDPEYRARLTPGEYEMRVRAVYADAVKSDWSPPRRFHVKFPLADTVTPRANQVIESLDDEFSPVTLKWRKINHATRYRVHIYKRSGEMVADEETEGTELIVRLPADQTYLWNVQPYGPREDTREPASVSPASGSEFTIEPYIRLGLSAAEEPSQLYAWGRHLQSNINYVGKNRDNNSVVTQTIWGGSGELAAGYWHRKTSFGLLGAAALSGFNVANKNYTYKSGSLLLGYRNVLNPRNRFRLWGGIAYRETPEIKVAPFTQEVSFSKVGNYGPELRLSYLGTIQDRLGWQLYSSVYYGAVATQSPNGLAQAPETSYNIGILGTYEYSSQITAMAGYSYQYDAASYRTTDVDGGYNRIELAGHYISFTLTIGLQDAYK